MQAELETPQDPDGAGDADLRCQVCGEEVPHEQAIGCTRCGAPYHTDCFHYYGKCAIFGCGTATTRPFHQLPPVVRKHSVEITESTRPEFDLQPHVESLQRKFLTRAKDLPMTLGAGLVGSLMTIAGFMLFVSSAHSASLIVGLLFCGLGPGLVAPFVAPTQHRRPMLSSVITGLMFFFFYGMRFVGADLLPWTTRFFWSSLTVAAGIFFATSLAEGLFGKLTPIGNSLGRFAAPVRHLASWAFFIGSVFLGARLFGEPLSPLAYQEISVLSVLALVAAVPALEMGKEEHWRREIAATPSKGPLPSPSPVQRALPAGKKS